MDFFLKQTLANMPLSHLTSNFKVFATVRGRGALDRNQCPDSMPPARALIYNHKYTFALICDCQTGSANLDESKVCLYNNSPCANTLCNKQYRIMNLFKNVCKKPFVQTKKQLKTSKFKVYEIESCHHPHKHTMGSVHPSHQLLTFR